MPPPGSHHLRRHHYSGRDTQMSIIKNYGDFAAVGAGALLLATAGALGHVAAGWWIAWGVLAAVTAGARVYRVRVSR